MYIVPIIGLLLLIALGVNSVIYARHVWSWSKSYEGSSRIMARVIVAICSNVIAWSMLVAELIAAIAAQDRFNLQLSPIYFFCIFIADLGVGISFTCWFVTRGPKANRLLGQPPASEPK